MIVINREEAMALRDRYGEDAHITITSKNKKGGRKKYYAAEDRRNVLFIERFREKRIRQFKKRGGCQ